jgi:carotenoid cleavage dioxygenase
MAARVNDDNPYLHGSFGPVGDEVTAAELEVIGEIPRDLYGTYVRNGPNAKFEPRGRYHWFDGDGMLHAMRFEDGRATYRNRYVRTGHLAVDEAAGAAQWTGLMESTRENPRAAPYKDTANTDVVFHAGSLLASWYICGQPYRVDAGTLETIGPAAWGKDVGGVSAHTKVDPATGELMFFRYGPRAPFLSYGVVDAAGALTHHTDVDLPGPRLPHDMAITRNHSILMDLPVFYTPEALTLKRWLVGFYPELPARFGVVPRHGAAVRWFEAEPCYIYHTINAWEEGDEIVLVGCRVADPLPPDDPRDGVWANMMANLRITANLHRWRFNLATGETREERLDDRNAEFPSVDPRVIGARSRHAYSVILGDEPTLRFTGLMKYDTDSGASQAWEWGPGRYGSESPFAPRGSDGAEDDGYVVSFVHDEREARSEVAILRAEDLAAGPVARVLLPQRVPLGFHACWVPGDQA